MELGLTLTGKPLKDQAEAKNLSEALDFLEDLATNNLPITERDLRQMHYLVLKGIQDEEAGKYRTIQKANEESFYARYRSDITRKDGIEHICRQFIEEVVSMHFSS